MANIFDDLSKQTFDVASRTMGYDASWTPSQGGATQTARVLFKRPTSKEELDDWDYDPMRRIMEYREGDFVGLFDAARENRGETVTIDGDDYAILAVRALFDGRNYKALLTIQD